MLMTLATTLSTPGDLGYLLHKHPDRLNRVALSFGEVLICYPEVSSERVQMALTVQIPFDRAGPQEGEPYVSDRPYAAGSYLSIAISKALSTALGGRCDARPELVGKPLALDITLTPVPLRPSLLPDALFEPLGWRVATEPVPLDGRYPQWGSLYQTVRLTGEHTLSDALRHVCVMLLVMTNQRHYFVGDDEIERLQRLGEGWLDRHPLAGVIRRRFLRYRELIDKARQCETVPDDGSESDEVVVSDEVVEPVHGRVSLQQLRIETAGKLIMAARPKRVVDFGCGEGMLIQYLLAEGGVGLEQVIGVDPSALVLDRARKRLSPLLRKPEMAGRVSLLQGAATYPDTRLVDVDAVALLEVIEHVEPDRLPMLEQIIFNRIRPPLVVLTTPNRDWNRRFPDPDGLRHRDHRFEWSMAEFAGWTQHIVEQFGYAAHPFGVGDISDDGPATQGCCFKVAS